MNYGKGSYYYNFYKINNVFCLIKKLRAGSYNRYAEYIVSKKFYK